MTYLPNIAPPQQPTNPLQAGAPMPPSVGQAADALHDIRELRLAMQKEVDAVKARELEIENWIIEQCQVDTGGVGMRYKAVVKPDVKPRIADWATFSAAIFDPDHNLWGRLDLVQKRLSDTAIKELWDANVEVPGVEKFNAKKVSVTKI